MSPGSIQLVVGQFESRARTMALCGETEIEGDRQGLHGQRRFWRTAWKKQKRKVRRNNKGNKA